MQKVYTTIIIGAGANKEIHREIDLGIDLIRNISNRVTDRTSKAPYLSSSLMKHRPELTGVVRDNFVVHLDQYINASTTEKPPSIDYFIENVNKSPELKAHKENFLNIGRLMILAHILGFEGCTTKENIKNEVTTEKTWLSVLGNYLKRHDQLKTNPREHVLQIITFNYDRILEYYLIQRFGQHAIEFINKNVHHVYGRIGNLAHSSVQLNSKYPDEPLVTMGHINDDFTSIANWVKNIKLINERNDTSDIKKIIEGSNKIIAMGYGFDPVNNSRLGLDKFKTSGTNFIFNIYRNDKELSEKVRKFREDTDLQSLDCVDFLNYGLNMVPL
jgi:hypothetical protein